MSAARSDQQPLLHQQHQSFDGAIGANATHKILTKLVQSTAHPAQFDQPLIDVATLQVSGGTAANKDAKSDSKEESHEHPCICDLRLPRKSLSNEERFARYKDSCRAQSTSTGKSPSSSPERKRVAGQRPAKRVISAPKSTVKTKTSPKKAKPGSAKELGTDKKPGTDNEAGRAVGPAFGKRTTARSRSRGPQIAVKLNRAATLRLEKGNTYCGNRRPEIVDRFRRQQDQRAEAARGKKKQRQRKARSRSRSHPRSAECPYLTCKNIR